MDHKASMLVVDILVSYNRRLDSERSIRNIRYSLLGDLYFSTQGWGQILKKKKQKKSSNLCGDTADFIPPPPYLGQDFSQSPVIDMCASKVLHWLQKKQCLQQPFMEDFSNVAWAFTPWMQH